MTKYLRVMDGTVSNQSGLDTKIDEVIVSRDWDPEATELDTIKGINFSTEESIIRWIRRGTTLYDVIIPEDAEVKVVPSSFTPNGILRANKIILTNPRPLTEDIVMDLYRKTSIPERTYPDVLGILAIKGFEKVCEALIKDKVTKNNIEEFLNNYIEFENDIHDNNYGLYYKYREILKNIKKEFSKSKK